MTKRNKDLENALNELHLYIDKDHQEKSMNETEKAEILNSVIKKIEMQKNEPDTKKFNRKGNIIVKKKYTKVAVAALGILLVGSTITVSARTILMQTPIARYFGIEAMDEDSKKEKLEKSAQKMVQDLSVSDTQNGLKVSVNQAFGDDYTCYLSMNVTGFQKNKEFDNLFGNGTFGKIEASIPDNEIIQTSLHNEGGNDDNSNNYLMVIGCDKMQESNISLKLKNFGYYDSENNFIPVIKGTWNLDWNLSYSTDPKKYTVDENIDIYGSKAVWNDVTFTPISASVSLKMLEPNTAEMTDGVDANNELYVDFADGNRVSTRFADEDAIYNDTTNISLSFSKIVDLDDIVSVTFAGVTYPVNAEKAPHKNVYTNEEMKFSLSFSDDMYKLLDISKTTSYKDPDFKKNAQKVDFVMKKENTKMTLCTVFRVKGMWSKDEAESINPMATYVDYFDGYTYFIQYGEIVDEAQANAFSDILNKEPYLLHLISFIK